MALETHTISNEEMTRMAKVVRRHILAATTTAGSGHPTSSFSAVELMVSLLWGGHFSFDTKDPEHPCNDRLIFSKGHAAPLLYALYTLAGAISRDELLTLRQFDSRLEGHPTTRFPYTEAATGSLGQGLSVGLGMALNAKYIDKLPYRTYVLLGDSEMAEGSIWEAMQIASYYQLDNLVGMIDVNRLGQRGETMLGHDITRYAERAASFGWHPLCVTDGHSFESLLAALAEAKTIKGKPVMLIARTTKGKGVSFIEDQNGWHGKTLTEEEYARALTEIGDEDDGLTVPLLPPQTVSFERMAASTEPMPLPRYDTHIPIAPRKAYGNALVRVFPHFPDMVVLDAETSNSTYAATFKDAYPDRFFEMFIAEQNMVSTALGLSRRGKVVFVSTFAAFLTRALDQIRMSQYSHANVVFVGSHAGVSIGEDGVSQMGLIDIAMFRAVIDSVVLYPSDAISTERLVEEAAKHIGISYLRTTRAELPILYPAEESFPIGGSKVLRSSENDTATVVGAGITLHEALAAHDILAQEGISVRVIDLYSIKPIDEKTLVSAARETGNIITVEDHYAEGGLGEAVMHTLAGIAVTITPLAVRKMPHSGKPMELIIYEEIDRNAIIAAVKKGLAR